MCWWMDGINEKSQIPLENEPAKTFSDFVCGWCTIRLSRSSLFSGPNRFFPRSSFLNQFKWLYFAWVWAEASSLWQEVGHFFLFFFFLPKFMHLFVRSMAILIFIWDLSQIQQCEYAVVHNWIDVWMFLWPTILTEAGEWRKKTSEIDPFYLFSSFRWQNGTMQTYNLFKFIFAWIQIEGPYNVLVTVPSWRDEEKKILCAKRNPLENKLQREKNCTWK